MYASLTRKLDEEVNEMAMIMINHGISSNVMGMVMLSWMCHKGLKQATCVLSLGALPWCVDSEVHEVCEGVPKEKREQASLATKSERASELCPKNQRNHGLAQSSSKRTGKERETEREREQHTMAACCWKIRARVSRARVLVT